MLTRLARLPLVGRLALRSLATKMVLAFLLTSVAGVVLTAVFIRQFVTRQFDDYVLEQQRDSFVEEVKSYYETHGSLAGIESVMPRRLIRIASISSASPSSSSSLSDRDAIPARDINHAFTMTMQDGVFVTRTTAGPALPPSFRQWQFGLVNAADLVVLPFDGHPAGETLRSEDIARGTPVLINNDNGVLIGKAITAGPLAFRRASEEAYLSRTDLALLIAAGVMVGVALVLGIVLARVITRPLREMTMAASKIASGDLEQVVPVRSSDELGVLANQFNHMSADLVRATQLRRQMTADIAHDLRTPLTVISGYMEALRDQILKPTPERFSMMHDEIQLLRHLVEDLHTLNVADAGELHLERQSIAPMALLNRVTDAYQDAAERQGIALRVQANDRLPNVCVDLEHTIRAVSNLVSNALRYTGAGGKVTLAANVAGDRVQLRVADTGSGIAPEHLPNIFERSYRADASRRQDTGETGLGLAIVKSIIEAQGGQVGVESLLGHGTIFTIALPVA